MRGGRWTVLADLQMIKMYSKGGGGDRVGGELEKERAEGNGLSGPNEQGWGLAVGGDLN